MARAVAIESQGRQRTLVVAPAWVGDMVMAHAIVPGLAERGHDVHFLAPPTTTPLAARMPGVQATHDIDVRHGQLGLRERRRAGQHLRKLAFDNAIVLPNSFKSALPPFFANIPKRTGFRGEMRYGLLNDLRSADPQRWPRLVDRFGALADVPPAPPRLRADSAAGRRLAERWRLPLNKPVVALCPGAEYGPAKRWPTARFAALAQQCVGVGAAVWVLGGSGEKRDGAAIAEQSGATDLTGKTSLTDVIDLLAFASVAVSNDSGLMHVAAALDIPVVAIYGSTSPACTPPLASRVAIVEEALPCRPCFQRRCPLDHTNCLRGIGVERVFAEVRKLVALEPALRAGNSP